MQDDRPAGPSARQAHLDDPAGFDRLFEAYCDPLVRFVYRYVQ